MLLVFIGLVSISIWSTYFFTFEPPLGYRYDPHRAAIELAKHNALVHFALTQPMPLGSYISTIKDDLRNNYTNAFVKESVFFGQYARYGFPGYLLLIILLIKTPLPLLLFFLISIMYGFKTKQTNLFLLVPMAVVLGSSLFTHVLLVLRYILPVYPLMIIFSSQALTIPYKKTILFPSLAALTLWYIAGTLMVFPHYLSYVNETIGGEKNGYKFLAEGNFDFG